MKCNKKTANIISITVISLAVICVELPLYCREGFHFLFVNNGTVFILFLCILFLISGVFFFLGDRDLQYKLEEIRCKKSDLLKIAARCENEIQGKKACISKELRKNEAIIEKLLAEEAILNITPGLKNMLERLITLNGDYYKTLDEKCRIFVEYIEEMRKDFTNVSGKHILFENWKVKSCRILNLDRSLLRKVNSITETIDKIKEEISILAKQDDTENFIAQLKSCICINNTCFTSCTQTLSDSMMYYKINIDELMDCVSQERAIIEKMLKAKENPTIISDSNIASSKFSNGII